MVDDGLKSAATIKYNSIELPFENQWTNEWCVKIIAVNDINLICNCLDTQSKFVDLKPVHFRIQIVQFKFSSVSYRPNEFQFDSIRFDSLHIHTIITKTMHSLSDFLWKKSHFCTDFVYMLLVTRFSLTCAFYWHAKIQFVSSIIHSSCVITCKRNNTKKRKHHLILYWKQKRFHNYLIVLKIKTKNRMSLHVKVVWFLAILVRITRSLGFYDAIFALNFF